MTGRVQGVFTAAVIVVVVAAVAGGLFLIGSPAQERVRRIDSQRVSDLSAMAGAVDLYWTRHTRLPASLEELAAEPGAYVKRVDPVTQRPYEYRACDGNTYELCASFDRESTGQPGNYYYRDFWAHGAGRQCFKLEALEIKR
jgi:hypothetical protein